jgi:hypothetical protein
METIEHIEFDPKTANVGDTYRHMEISRLGYGLSSYKLQIITITKATRLQLAIVHNGLEYKFRRDATNFEWGFPTPMKESDTERYNNWVISSNAKIVENKARIEKIKAVDFDSLSENDLERVWNALRAIDKVKD